jgi:hypothetical protein
MTKWYPVILLTVVGILLGFPVGYLAAHLLPVDSTDTYYPFYAPARVALETSYKAWSSFILGALCLGIGLCIKQILQMIKNRSEKTSSK